MKKLKSNKWLLCFTASIAQIISNIILVRISVLTGEAIDYATSGLVDKLVASCIIIFIITVLNNLFFIAAVWCSVLFYNGEKARLREMLVKNLFRMSLFSYRKRDDAYYITMLTSDTDKVGEEYYGAIAVELKFIALFVSSIVAITYIEPILFFLSVLFAVIPLGTSYLFEKRGQEREINCSRSNELLNNELLQFVQNYEMLKINNAKTERIVYAIGCANKVKVDAEVKSQMWQAWTYNILDTVNSFGQLALIACGGYLILKEKITAGELVTCIMLSEYVCSSVSSYLRVHVRKRAVLPIKKKLQDEAMAEWEDKSAGEEKKQDASGFDIAFCNVSFRYPGSEQEIISNSSRVFQPGKCYGIVGESGCGKSTYTKLLLKYQMNYEGNIYLGGKEIRDYSDEELYQKIGLLNQNESILNTTIEDNITLFEPERAKTNEYAEIIRKLNLTELIEKTGNRKLGDFGETISGGEKQRIALARVLLRNPKVLILDEPMTGLDPENQAMLNEVLFSLDGMTRIIITHDGSDDYLSRFDELLSFNRER